MLIPYDNYLTTMGSSTLQRQPTAHFSLPLRTLAPQSSQLNVGRPTTTSIYKRTDGVITNPSILESPFSPLSCRSVSSFSQGSSAEHWEIIPGEPSPPHTPNPKHEFDDAPRLDLVPPHRDFLKRKFSSPDDRSKRVKLPDVRLPSLHRLLPPSDHEDYHTVIDPRARASLHTPSASPEPNHDYTFAAEPADSGSEDAIVRWLNIRRKESNRTKGPLSQPRGLESVSLNINLDFREKPVFYREKQQYTSPCRGPVSRPRQPPSPPRDLPEEESGKVKKEPHINIKYRLEETDFIRFNKYELKKSWKENERLFKERFPMAEANISRKTQGIQGVHYRDNLHLPCLAEGGEDLEYLPEGHVKAVAVKVREQSENKKLYGLIYLYPERALTYDWVPAVYKQKAAELVKRRILQRERVRRDAMDRGILKETVEKGECACCYKPDRDRDTIKRSASEHVVEETKFKVPVKYEFEFGVPVDYKPSPLYCQPSPDEKSASLKQVHYADGSR
ncbi:hypothetical protein GGR54DRAFT_629003 [Hypoxylon sp. NC1633]|nr:hypothetical protein GGR54DRAFT_629003 [Hypoxylon sp. NC1633]